MQRKDKIKGLLLGGAIGDALGSPFERRSGYDLKYYTGKLEFQEKIQVPYQGTFLKAVGQYSDDTEMTLLVLNGLIENKLCYSQNDNILAYLNWANMPCNANMGNNTRALFKGVKTLRGYKSRYAKVFKSIELIENNQSNGALMRCSPLALIHDDSLRKEAVVQDCSITNPSSVAIEVNTIYVEMIHFILSNPQACSKTIVEYGQELATNKDIKIAFQDAIDNIDRDISGKDKGWCIHALYTAIKALLLVDDYGFGQTINEIIMFGGDTDTNAAISGNLIGYYLGLSKMDDDDTLYNIDAVLNINWTNDRYVSREEIYKLTREKLDYFSDCT